MIRCKVKINRILWPKREVIEGGEWAIVSVKVVSVPEGGEQPQVGNYGTFSIKGTFCKIKSGDVLDVSIDKVEENKYGFTYELQEIHLSLENLTDEELLNYTLELITNESIKNEVKQTENIIQIIRERNVEELTKIKGVGEKVAERLFNKIDERINYHKAIAELNKYGISNIMINKICDSYSSPDEAVRMIKENPYDLIEKVDGIGYIKADEIAIKCGIDKKSPHRIRAAVKHVLETNAENGKSYVTIFDFTTEIISLLDLKYDVIKPVLTEMRKNKEILLSGRNTKISLYEYAKLENEIAKSVIERLKAPLTIKKPENWMDTVRQIEKEQGWCYTDEQLSAIEAILDNNVVVVTGLAGTGKTTIIEAAIRILNKEKPGTCALSAKAAQRIEEVTKRPSFTIHRMFGFHYTSLRRALHNRLYRKSLHQEDPEAKPKPYESCKIMVLDEGSMPNGTLYLEILNYTKDNNKIVILGDPGQLTAIGNCSVFYDLINSKVVPTANLTKIHRQAQKSAMITESINVRMQNSIYSKGFRGKKVMGELEDLELHVYDDVEEINEVVIDSFFRDLELCDNNVLDVQIILPMKNRGINCTKVINNAIQDRYIEDKDFGMEVGKDITLYVGDKVINTSNNYNATTITGDKTEIFNGNIGIVVDIDFTKNEVTVDFGEDKIIVFNASDAKGLNLAYAITTHSSQGSAWKMTIVALDNSSYIMLNCELVYTAMTRAYEHCTLVVEDKAFEKAIRTKEQKTKATFLQTFLELNSGDKPLNL